MSTRRKPESSGEVLGVPYVCSVLDFARFADISAARDGVEPIEIDVAALNGSPLPCLPPTVATGSMLRIWWLCPANS